MKEKSMKKFILNVMLMFSMVMGVSAQTAIETPKFFDNWYVGVNGGATTNLDFNSVFPLNANVGVVLGKDFTPVFGAQIEGVTWLGDKKISRSHTWFKVVDLGLNGTVNLTNLFCGYNGIPRTFEVSTVTGIGWMHIYADHNLDGTYGKEDNDEFLAKTAMNFAWNLGKSRAHQLYVQPGIYWNLTNTRHDPVHFNKHFAQIGVSLGYVYKFKTSNGTHNFVTYDIGAVNDRINHLMAENDALRKAKPGVTTVTETVEKIVKVSDVVVYFAQGSDVLTAEAKAALDNVATSATVDIVGTASPEGSDAVNNPLSERRANNVAEYLKNRGVTVNSITGKGVTGETSNRVAIVTVK